MGNRYLRVCAFILASVLLPVCGPAYSQTQTPAGTAATATAPVPFSVKNAFFQENGMAWAAATDQQRAEFLARWADHGTAQTTPAIFQPDKTTAFGLKNIFYNQYGYAWETATPAQQKEFIRAQTTKKREKVNKDRAYKKQRELRQKLKLKIKRDEETRTRKRIRAEQAEKKAERDLKIKQTKKMGQLKAKARALSGK